MQFLICSVLCLILSPGIHGYMFGEEAEPQAIAATEHFQLEKDGKICILADFEANFKLNITYEDKMHSKSFPLDPVAKVNVSGSCADQGAQASLVLTTDQYVLEFLVSSTADLVSAQLQYVLTDVLKMFPEINYTDPITFGGKGEEFPNMGSKHSSYECLHQETFRLNSNDTNVTATVDISFSDLKFQAFDVDKQYNTNITECDGDLTSSTSTPTTTMTPAKGRGNYIVENNGTACLRLEANITLMVMMNETVTKMVRVPRNAMVSGTCADETENPSITLTFMAEDEDSMELEAEAGGNLTFTFAKEENYAFIENVDFVITFFNATNSTVKGSASVNDVLSTTSNAYTCPEEDLKVGDNHVILQELEVQVFGLNGGNYTKALSCQDAPKKPTDSNYTFTAGGVTCISMSGELQLEIPYQTTADKNGSKLINFTKDQPTEGSCGTGNDSVSEYILIKFHKNDFQIQFDFAKEGASSMLTADETFSYFVQNITVKYSVNSEFFPDAKNFEGNKTAEDRNKELYKTSSNMYYKCNTDQTISLSNGVNLVTKDFKFVAFHNKETPPDFTSGNANECSADTETNSIVPIAVGAALAGLVVIVLIAYLIGRRRSHKGYESV